MIETMKSSPYSPQYDKIRFWLKLKREESGLSLREAAKAMGRHHSVIGKMEQDRRKIEIFEFLAYCKVLEADPHEGLDIMLKAMK
jgi:transcriptional regulator with XRE-family HTH domain